METDEAPRPAMVAWLGYGGVPPFMALVLLASLCLASINFFGPVLVSQGITV
jgi:hypothetical protein